MQAYINIFWDGNESNDKRLDVFNQIIVNEDWILIRSLYFYLWRANFNTEPNNSRYNKDLR